MTTELPRVSAQDVLNCSFSIWYPLFKKHSFKSVILNLTDDILQYLRSDEFYLPTSANKAMDEMRTINVEPSSDDDDDEDHWSDDDTNNDNTKQISFPEFEKQILNVLDEYDAVFPKLNWSSPKDARWMISDNRLKCTNLADIFLLLKSSDFITHDLCEPFKFCHDDENNNNNLASMIQYVLVLRKWSALQPSKEFRCFVRNNQLIAISQRDNENYYDFISSSADQIRTNLIEFFTNHIQNKFPSIDFVVDIYRKDANKFYIIDFNPWGPMTDSLLFDWSELLTFSNNEQPEFRYINSQNGIKPNSYTQYSMPKDIADITRECDINKLADVLSSRIQTNDTDE